MAPTVWVFAGTDSPTRAVSASKALMRQLESAPGLTLHGEHQMSEGKSSNEPLRDLQEGFAEDFKNGRDVLAIALGQGGDT